jgi:hypothetical protein
VVATCPSILVFISIDLTGSAFGSGCGTGRGIQGLISHLIGIITPCEFVETAPNKPVKNKNRELTIVLNLITNLLKMILAQVSLRFV